MKTVILLLIASACGTPRTSPKSETASASPGSAITPSAGSAETSAAPPRPASVTDDTVTTSDRVIAAIDKLASDVDAAADCGAATAALRSNKDSMRAVMADADRLEKLWRSADAAAKRWFEATYRPRLSANNDKVMKKVAMCKGDPEFDAALRDANSH